MSDTLQHPEHALDAWPPPAATAVLSLQWLVVLVPGLLVLGEVVAGVQGLSPASRVAYNQRLFLACGLTQMAQVYLGHRLPGLVGPSTVLLVGAISTMAAGPGAVYGGMLAGGALLALAGLVGLGSRLRSLFTPPVLASTLVLIAMTLAPTLVDLLFSAGIESFGFGVLLVLAMLWAQRALTGLASSAVLLMGLVAGSALWPALGLGPAPSLPALGGPGLPALMPEALSFQPGVIAAFALCFLALTSNELATVEALGRVIGSSGQAARVNRAMAADGFGSMLSGLLGVIGPVTYSVSPALVVATKSASRYTLVPAAGLLLVMGLWPGLLSLFSLVPAAVVGAVLFYLMATTIYASLSLLTGGGERLTWRGGTTVGAAMMAGLVIALMPQPVREALPPLLRPLLANGFVIGLLMAMLLDRLLLRGSA